MTKVQMSPFREIRTKKTAPCGFKKKLKPCKKCGPRYLKKVAERLEAKPPRGMVWSKERATPKEIAATWAFVGPPGIS